jgi:hypothetical protein
MLHVACYVYKNSQAELQFAKMFHPRAASAAFSANFTSKEPSWPPGIHLNFTELERWAILNFFPVSRGGEMMERQSLHW